MNAAKATRSSSADQTEALAEALAAGLQAGDVVHVCGEVGAGKTTFIRGACRALGFNGTVTSPSFTIVNRYEGGPVAISHLDCQRLEQSADVEAGLFDDEIAKDRICFIEWPQQSAAAVGRLATVPAAVRVELRHLGEGQREVLIERSGIQ